MLQILHSEPIRARIIEKYNLMEHYEIEADARYPLTALYNQYRSNINFRLTEYMSVEIAVMDRDPEYAANMANEMAMASLIKKAGRANANETKAANLSALRDSMNRLSKQFSAGLKSGGDAGNNLVRAISENGPLLLTMQNLVRYEAQMVSELSLRYKEARLEAEQNLSHRFVVEEAYPSEKKAYPRKSLIVIVSTFSALLFALVVLIIADNIRARVAIQEEK